jgi:hypothetical protein
MDKITTTMMSMAMILPVMSSGYKILTSNKVKDTLATLEGNTAY